MGRVRTLLCDNVESDASVSAKLRAHFSSFKILLRLTSVFCIKGLLKFEQR